MSRAACDTLRVEDLQRLLQPVAVKGPLHGEIAGVTHDSRQVRPGFLFVALRGERYAGNDFAGDAARRGAVAIVSEDNNWTRRDIPHLRVADARLALADIACAFYGEPSRRLILAGITGTNGKTTTAFMLRNLLQAAGRKPGLIGTVRYEIGDRLIPASRTTPEAPDIQAMLDQMAQAGCQSCVMEVSSHGLAQQRVQGVDFDVGVFTNLTQDHLDFHRTMEEYFTAKTRLFSGLGRAHKAAHAVLNLDDPWGRRLAAGEDLRARVLTYGTQPGAAVRAEQIEVGADGSRFQLQSPWGSCKVRLRMLGRFNVSNALAAVAAGGALAVPLPTMAESLAAMEAVPGRLEPVANRRGLALFVDYAHTEDALRNVLQTLREITRGRLLVVFGCGGDRDRGKRPRMGAAAEELADYAVLTSDNPRRENPADILAGIAAGFRQAGRHEIVPDREKAIARALELAAAGDTLVVAGKGHETYQEFADTVVPFDDREVLQRKLESPPRAAG